MALVTNAENDFAPCLVSGSVGVLRRHGLRILTEPMSGNIVTDKASGPNVPRSECPPLNSS